MSRLRDLVTCGGGGGPALTDHGAPTASAGGSDYYVDSSSQLPTKEAEALARALESGDPMAISKAWAALPRSNTSKVTVKVVDPAHPDAWHEYELSGPGATVPGNPIQVDGKKGGGRVQVGGGAQRFGAKKTYVERYVAEDGSLHERRASASGGVSEGFSVDAEWSDERKGIVVDTPWDLGAGYEDAKVGDGTKPGMDIIVMPVSPDVLLGD
jgi:hypothetical protein